MIKDHNPDNYAGYVNAFYELVEILGIPAQTLSPKEVWEQQMRPAIIQMIEDIKPGKRS